MEGGALTVDDAGRGPSAVAWAVAAAASGALALGYEAVWMRRVALLVGSSALASSLTVGAFMAGLAVGAVAVRRVRAAPGRVWAACELLAALWALGAPWVQEAAWAATSSVSALRGATAALLVAIPAVPLGATWPALVRGFDARGAALLYAANTAGAVLGVLGATFALLPALGTRSTELALAVCGLGLAWAVQDLAARHQVDVEAPGAPRWLLAVAALAGAVSLALEVVWFRLAAVAFGGTVQVHGVVLATFLATVAAGAWVGRAWPADPRRGVALGLGGLGLLASAGATLWGQLPFAVARLYELAGAEAMVPGAAALGVVLMGGAPAASGLVFSAAVRALGDRLDAAAPALYGANTLGSIVGAWGAALVLVPALEPRGAVAVCAAASGGAAIALGARGLGAAALVAPLLVPAWDAKLYAVGVHLRVHEFADTSAAAVRRFADEGWELLAYDHGTTGAVAVGRSTRTGNLWLSIDGKVDASTGEDMPTQILSGTLPLAVRPDARDVLVVGLASGITAGAVLSHPGVERLTVVELEPAVVAASRHFDAVSGAPLDDPRTELVVDDARAVLASTDRTWDVLVSEPSNPWISGVSNLFTVEYWRLARSRLRPGGVMIQWVQLYGLPPSAFRALIRSFVEVFGDVWLVETIAGSDVLLIGGPARLPPGVDVTLTPDQVRRLAGVGWLNTDDHPRVEWEAPRWLHASTGAANRALLEEAASR